MSTVTAKQRLQDDMKSSMKSGDKERLGVIRLILAAIKQREVDERIQLDESQVIAVLDKMVKQRRESVSQYSAANREDLAEVERSEIAVIQAYLPQALSDAEVDAMIVSAVTEVGATGIGDMGKIMAILKPKMQGRADMSAVSSSIKARLSAS